MKAPDRPVTCADTIRASVGHDTQQGQINDSTLSGPVSEGIAALSSAAFARMRDRPFECLFLADWTEATFLHFEVDGMLLQKTVPFEIHQHNGRSFISLVAFTMQRFRLRRGGAFTRWATAPIANHRFLNLRTYVKGSDGPGIFFMAEWLDNRLAVSLGPATFGLPYRYAKLDYRRDGNLIRGLASSAAAEGAFSGELAGRIAPAVPHSLDAFFLERYTAYTAAGFRPLSFRVWHLPWQFQRLEADRLECNALLAELGQSWASDATFVGATFSEGVEDVWMGRPRSAEFRLPAN